jgi:hypothetical protein
VTPTATETLTFFELWEKFKEHKFGSGIANTTKSKYESTTTGVRRKLTVSVSFSLVM